MINLNEMTQEQLRVLRAHWVTEQNEVKRERQVKGERFTSRLNSQGESQSAQEGLEARIADAQQVYDAMVAANIGQATIDLHQSALDALQNELNSLTFSSSYITHQDQQEHLMEQDELKFAIDQRATRIAEIDALLV